MEETYVDADAGDVRVSVEISLPAAIAAKILAEALREGEADGSSRVALAKHILAGRRRRDKLFPGVRFGEPTWDMILDLYVATAIGQKVDVSGLYLASNVAPTTAVRYVEMLAEAGLVTRTASEQDGRRWFVAMTDRLRQMIEQWLDIEMICLQTSKIA